MKKTLYIFGIICLAAIIGLGLAACDTTVLSSNVEPEGDIVRIIVSKLPNKMSYDINDEFDPAGMIIGAVYSDGSIFPVTGYEYTRGRVAEQQNPPLVVGGTSTVTITYQEFMTTLTVAVYDASVMPCATPIGMLNGVVIPPGDYNIYRGDILELDTTQTEGGRIEIWFSVNGYGASRDGMRIYQYGGTRGSQRVTPPLTLQPGMLNADNAPKLTIKTVTVADGWHNSPEAQWNFTFLDF